MELKPAVLKCSKCGRAAPHDTPKCPRCGGRVVKVCGACGFENSAAKNYCDTCGEPLKSASQLPPAKPEARAPLLPPPARPEPQAKPPDQRPQPAAEKAEAPKPAQPDAAKAADHPSIRLTLKEAKPPAPQESKGASGPAEEKPKQRPPAAEIDLPKTSIIRVPERTPEDVERMLKKLGIPDPEALFPSRAKPPEPAQKAPAPEPPAGKAEAPVKKPEPVVRRGPYGRPIEAPRGEPPKAQLRRREEPAKEAPKGKPRDSTFYGRATQPVASTLLGLGLFILTAALYGLYYWHFKHNPRTKLVHAAARYLTALRTGDVDSAYHGLLSDAARGAVSIEEFKRYLPPSGWSFDSKDISIEAIEEDWALVRYDARAPGSPPEKNRMEFVQEGGRWLRAYDWSLLARAEQALDEGDYAAADESARKASAVNPRGALARYYLCESAYDRHSAQEALDECRKAVELAKQYPPGLRDTHLFLLHSILADLCKNLLDKPEFSEAVREYGILLSLPGLDAPRRCDLLLARADTRVLLGDYSTASKDYQEAGGACASEDDISYARACVRIFSGQAGLDAVDLTKRQRMPDDQSTVLEWREAAHEELLLKLKGTKLKPSQDSWHSEYLGGPNYKVTVRNADVELLEAHADLWAKKIKVNFHVQ